MTSPDSTRNVVLVTGTSSGLGLAVAVALAQHGWRVVATMRNPDRADALRRAAQEAGVELDVRGLDVVDDDSVDSCIGAVIADYGRLDAVVNNAGLGHVGALEHDSIEDVRRVMEVNFFGVVRVTQRALPHLRASRGRLVTVTSVGGVVGQPFADAYCASKFAVEGLMESMASTLGPQGVDVVVVEPGYIRSRFLDNSNVGSADGDASAAEAGEAEDGYGPLRRAYLQRVTGGLSSGQSPEEAAQAVVDAVLGEAQPLRRQTSESARQFVALKLQDLDGAAVQQAMAAWVATGR